MTLADKTLHVCNCNGTMPLDAAALARALELAGPLPLRTQLCRKELAAFSAESSTDTLVACTQEAPLFEEVARESNMTKAIRFVNIRETGGWSADARLATPKIAALIAAAALPEPEPVPRVAYRSEGRVLIVGPADAALYWATALKEQLTVTVLAIGRATGTELPAERAYPIYSGRLERIAGWLGEFDVTWSQENPIDLDLCTRCNACVRACPEHAIDFSYQIDLDRCRDHRACVAACGAVGAIDFDRSNVSHSERFDLILDLSREPYFRMHQPPQGYYHPGRDPVEQAHAVTELVQAVGDFEKPKFFNYKASICAHSRAQKPGCNQCIDVCSTVAISADGDHIRVEPHLCMGCGACTTVCPSGALSYAYPSVPDLGARIRTLLATYSAAGGHDPCLLLHDATGRLVIAAAARRGRGLPARVIPIEVHHMAATGLDVWLAALAFGASEVAVLATGAEAPEYASAVSRQMDIVDAIVQALGYQGQHCRLLNAADGAALERALWDRPAALTVRVPAKFQWSSDKRTTIDFAVAHLREHAPVPTDEIALPAGAPFGTIEVNSDTCTLCLACVGACPEGAINDNQETPQLRFIEVKCVQCGLCAATCPEHAITLKPRLALAASARQARVVHEAAIFPCARCGKPLATQKLIGNMLARLAGHSMFPDARSLDRLKMCADCRVIDMMKADATAGSIGS